MQTVIDFLVSIRPSIPFSTERVGTVASNSEIRRWCNNGGVVLNGVAVGHSDLLACDVSSLVFFPNSKRKTTVF